MWHGDNKVSVAIAADRDGVWVPVTMSPMMGQASLTIPEWRTLTGMLRKGGMQITGAQDVNNVQELWDACKKQMAANGEELGCQIRRVAGRPEEGVTLLLANPGEETPLYTATGDTTFQVMKAALEWLQKRAEDA